MRYTIAKAAERSGLSAYTLRFYDKEGLLPFVDRNSSGIRSFKESDFEWLGIITCLKNTGMPLKSIKEFIEWCRQGDSTIKKRLDMFVEQKKIIQAKIQEYNGYLDKVEYKIKYYSEAFDTGTVDIQNNLSEAFQAENSKNIKEEVF